ncbi:hypothetical protein A3F66_01525 [candidate division TM6 bacterium RIFCSPHIGHO2_12_FULL_32_22]|nr:MAG: hypothetical protein A3F66_01525 [candidate division TM6 bacterium RIFCSPHIGHO2_12_FULL_32_22]
MDTIQEENISEFAKLTQRPIDEGIFLELFQETPLTAVINKANVILTQLALRTGFNLRKKNMHGETPLLCAVKKRPTTAYALLELLFQAGNRQELLSDLTSDNQNALNIFDLYSEPYREIDLAELEKSMSAIKNKISNLEQAESNYHDLWAQRINQQRVLDDLLCEPKHEFSIFGNSNLKQEGKEEEKQATIQELRAAISDFNTKIRLAERRFRTLNIHHARDLGELKRLQDLESSSQRINQIRDMLSPKMPQEAPLDI